MAASHGDREDAPQPAGPTGRGRRAMSDKQSGSKTYARPAVFLVGLGFLSTGLGSYASGTDHGSEAIGAVPPLLLC